MGARQIPIIRLFYFLNVIAFTCHGLGQLAEGSEVDLAGAVVVAAEGSARREKAVEMLREEVASRTRAWWPVERTWPEGEGPVVVLATEAELGKIGAPEGAGPMLEPPGRAEGYRLEVTRAGNRPVVWILGEDDRGVLFGAGRLLRLMRLGRDEVGVASGLKIATSPRYPVRGHQLGYRPKTNSYDAWSAEMWEQYHRDMILFGCNAVELIPPRSDDDADSPHFPTPPLEMMKTMSGLADAYGLDVWIWYPAMDPDYSDAATMRFAVEEWGRVFQALPRVDAVFVPGGDPGRTPPGPLFELLKTQTENLRRFHPRATMWFSPKGFNANDFDEILIHLKDEPEWLAGLVFGPQVRMDLPDLRQAVPARYPIRFYPDITHSRTCQYPVPNWDRVFALTEGREVINPRPMDQAAILQRLGSYTNGFITYSEGCNDDVNKAIWSDLGWDPEADVVELLREYANLYLDSSMRDELAHGILALERNWVGPILTNAGIETTLVQFEAIERRAAPRLKQNWRFQQLLYRATYDAMLRRRLIVETAAEERALASLRDAKAIGAAAAVDLAESILVDAIQNPAASDLRARCGELAEALFQSIRMQLDVDRYQGQSGRGTSQETIDRPLNNAVWLRKEFEAIRGLDTEEDRLARIEAILRRQDPGPGGFYDDLGNIAMQPHLVRGPGFDEDPAGRKSVLMHFAGELEMPVSWFDQALTLYEQPLLMRYEGLDPSAVYRVRAVYSLGPIRLTANGLEVHGPLERLYEPVEFEVPAEATRGGTLTLQFEGEAGRGSNGRSVGVAEVWLIREPRAAR